MIVRALDPDGDWLFGKGKNDYLKDNDAIAQTIQTRLRSFLGNCFFDTTSGVDWFNLLGAKNQTALNLSISTVILNTPNVLSINQISVTLDRKRNLTISYEVKTPFLAPLRAGLGLVLDEDGDFLSAEDGSKLHA